MNFKSKARVSQELHKILHESQFLREERLLSPKVVRELFQKEGRILQR
jgi:hypothetical protein